MLGCVIERTRINCAASSEEKRGTGAILHTELLFQMACTTVNARLGTKFSGTTIVVRSLWMVVRSLWMRAQPHRGGKHDLRRHARADSGGGLWWHKTTYKRVGLAYSSSDRRHDHRGERRVLSASSPLTRLSQEPAWRDRVGGLFFWGWSQLASRSSRTRRGWAVGVERSASQSRLMRTPNTERQSH